MSELRTPDGRKELRIELTIDIEDGLYVHPEYQRLLKQGWMLDDIRIIKETGREAVVEAIFVREAGRRGSEA